MSHHDLGAFLSGTDLENLREQGNDVNCYVSLVVDTKGTYVAAVTRKLKTVTKVTTEKLSSEYECFGDGLVKDEEKQEPKSTVMESNIIEYYMLDVERHEVNNPLEWIDDRIEEIERSKKQKECNQWDNLNRWDNITPHYNTPELSNPLTSDFDKSGYLWDEYDNLEFKPDLNKFQPNKRLIHNMVLKLVTCTLFPDQNLDLGKWIKEKMPVLYGKQFSDGDSLAEWSGLMTDYLIYDYPADKMLRNDEYDGFYSKIAKAMMSELEKYKDNKFIKVYYKDLKRIAETYEYID